MVDPNVVNSYGDLCTVKEPEKRGLGDPLADLGVKLSCDSAAKVRYQFRGE